MLNSSEYLIRNILKQFQVILSKNLPLGGRGNAVEMVTVSDLKLKVEAGEQAFPVPPDLELEQVS